MKTYLKNLSPILGLLGAICVSSAAHASDAEVHAVAVEAEVGADEVSLMTDIIYEAALADAAVKTLDAKKDWFRVNYRDARTEPVTRNVNDDAESRYLDLADGERVEAEIPTKDVLIQVQTIEFATGSGPKPDDLHSFDARRLVLPAS